MPELPDIALYLEHLERRCAGRALLGVRLTTPFLLRTVDPPLDTFRGLAVRGFRRLGKRIIFTFPGDLFLVLHLMVAGRLHWRPPGAKPPGKIGLAAFDFADGTLVLTEAGSKRRASLHAVRGEPALRDLDPGGVEPLACTKEEFEGALRRENHTFKRALTDPRLFSGIGNAYSDEILHRARLSPVKLTAKATADEARRLFDATRQTLAEWTDRLRRETGGDFPEGVTAFRPDFAVHGRFRKPCPACGAPVQRIVHADNETNYCPRCQTGGRILADRSLSRLLKGDWPRSLDEL
ncbi:MAG: formamidopyrimidine-DNA glycosylase [Planctomycetes bacterium]|nr:formamidopyrimidine-DNA glycosylase [Planctomycetota bacterium]